MFPSRVIIAGATGLVGSKLTSMMAGSPAVNEVKVVTRRPTGLMGSSINEIHVDFDRLADSADKFDADVAYCCLGTTMKNAGSKEAFFRVDHDYVVEFATLVHRAGVRRFYVITAMGADEKSTFYYNRVKGETEKDLRQIGFAELHILRPSLLLGDRKESRPGESFGQFIMTRLSFLLAGPLKKYRPIRDITVARAMIFLSERHTNGIFVHNSEEIQKLGKA